MKNITILILSIILFNSSCKKESKMNSPKAISLFYFTGSIDAINGLSCDYMHNNIEIKKELADTIAISNNDFNRIKNFLNKNELITQGSRCDVRMILEFESNQICIGEFNCITNINEDYIESDLSNIYLIKYLSGYFNYFTKEQLIYDETIKKYGIPNNYKYIESNSPLERKEGVKIIFISK